MGEAAREVRARLVDPLAVVEALGLGDGAKRRPRGVMIRCPWHLERTPSCSVSVGGDGTLRVRCFGCDATGDVLHLVAVARGLDLVGDFARVLDEASAIVGLDLFEHRRNRPAPTPPSTAYPPREEVAALWNASEPVNRTLADPDPCDLAVAFFLARRRWWPPAVAALDIVRAAPLPSSFDWPSWWPSRWATSWRLIARVYRADGDVASVHARAVEDAEPKTRWPYHCRSAGLLFADARGAALLRGEPARLERVIVVEGLTDTVAMALEVKDAGRAIAVLGVAAGSSLALAAVRWPHGVPVVIATHDDQAGRRYAGEIGRFLPSARRMVL